MLTGAGLEVSLEPANGETRLLALEFRLTRAASCDVALGSARVRCTGDRAELRLGPTRPAPGSSTP